MNQRRTGARRGHKGPKCCAGHSDWTTLAYVRVRPLTTASNPIHKEAEAWAFNPGSSKTGVLRKFEARPIASGTGGSKVQRRPHARAPHGLEPQWKKRPPLPRGAVGRHPLRGPAGGAVRPLHRRGLRGQGPHSHPPPHPTRLRPILRPAAPRAAAGSSPFRPRRGGGAGLDYVRYVRSLKLPRLKALPLGEAS